MTDDTPSKLALAFAEIDRLRVARPRVGGGR